MEGLVSSYFGQGLAPSTQSAYSSAKRKYYSFCESYQFSLLPITQHKSSLFISYLATITSYLSALRHLTVESGELPPPRSEWPQLHYILKGIKRSEANSQNTRKRLPITAELMATIQAVLFTGGLSRWDHFSRTMIWAACCTGYFGFMRSGEFTTCRANQGASTIQVSDVATDSHANLTVVRLFLKKAKTDPFGKGIYIYLGKTSSSVCPVSAMLSYLAIHPSSQGPLFIWRDGSPLSQQQLVREVRKVLKEANLDHTSYAGHSFRIGAATSAGKAGVPTHIIKMMGRWESDAYTLYIRTPRESLANISSCIAP